MDKDLILGALTQQPVTIATLSSLTGLDSDQIAKQCYQMVKNGEIKRAKVVNPAAGKKGAAPTVYGYFLDESSSADDKHEALLAKNTSLEDRLADTQSALDLIRADRDKNLMENAGLVELIHTLKTENDTLQTRIAALEGNLELPACSPDEAVRNPGPSLGWLAVVAGKTYGSETEARLAAAAICTDETDWVEQYAESIAVAKIVAIAEPIVAVKWREAA
jgi:BMFP domain-containing protein YqiC